MRDLTHFLAGRGIFQSGAGFRIVVKDTGIEKVSSKNVGLRVLCSISTDLPGGWGHSL